MEDQDVAAAAGDAAPPFSELIREWLDEGDRLDEKATATIAAGPPAVERPFQRIVRRLRPALDRYRVVVLASVGLIPFFLLTLTHHGPAVPAFAVSTVSNAPAPPPAPPPVPEPPTVASPSAGRVASPPPTTAPKPRHRSSHRSKHRPLTARVR